MRSALFGALLLGVAASVPAAAADAAAAAAADAAAGVTSGVPPNVLLVSIDTLRADHLGCYGYARETSPALDRLAARSLRFADVHAPTPWTLPSHAAMLTGRHPLALGILDKAGKIPDSAATVAEGLRAAGYQSAAFVDSGPGGNVGASRGFARGFDVFAHGPHGGGGRFQHDAARTVDAGLDWLARRDPQRPFFLFLHTKSAHAAPVDDPAAGYAPYTKPESYVARFLPGGKPRFPWSEGELRGQRYLFEVNRRLSDGRLAKSAFPPAQVAELVALYDAGVRYVDDELGRLFAALAERGLDGNTVVIVTSDHGEGFLERHFFLHQELFHELIHVPLLLHDPRGRAAGVVERTVHLEDVAPTILELAGVRAPEGATGRSLLAKEAGEPAPRVTYFRFGKDAQYEAYGLEDGPWLLLHEKTAKDPAFRSELVPLHPREAASADAAARAAREREMQDRLLAQIAPLLAQPVEEKALDPERLEELRALGYVE
jgi:arylsulfatase A-like enzyme